MTTPTDLKARLIVAGTDSPSSGIRELLENILTPLVPHLKSYVKENNEMLRKPQSTIGLDCNLHRFDVVSLFNYKS